MVGEPRAFAHDPPEAGSSNGTSDAPGHSVSTTRLQTGRLRRQPRPGRPARWLPGRCASSPAGGDRGTETHHTARMPSEKLVTVPAAERGVGADRPAARTHARRLMDDGKSLSGPAAGRGDGDAVCRQGRSGTHNQLAGSATGGSSRTGLHETSISVSATGGRPCGVPEVGLSSGPAMMGVPQRPVGFHNPVTVADLRV